MNDQKSAPATAGTDAEAVIELQSNGHNLHTRMAHDQIFFDMDAQSLPRLRDQVMVELMTIQRAANDLVRRYIEVLRRDDGDATTACQCVAEGLSQITSNATRLTVMVAERQAQIHAGNVTHLLVDTPADYHAAGISVQDAADELSRRGEESQLAGITYTDQTAGSMP